jgi:hypothetical protein
VAVRLVLAAVQVDYFNSALKVFLQIKQLL